MLIKKLSIKHYALSFILLYILVFVINTFIAFSDINQVNQQLIQTHRESGHSELKDAIQLLINNSRSITERFAAWDEVQQQINNPGYYSYWQSHRLFSSAILPESIVEASVYNIEGEVLGRLETATLPNHISNIALESYFTVEHQLPYLITTARIIDPDNTEKTQGYVITKNQVLPQLLLIKQYNYVDSQTIKSYYLEKKKISHNDFINYLTFEIKPNDETELYSDHLKQALLRNLLVLAGFALFFYFLMSFFISRPLRKVSRYIDMLNKNPEFQYTPEMKFQFNILELEKVRESLTQYQSKLQSVYINLDDKNKELWDLAHHDALTGALNRRAFEEQWKNIADIYEESRCHVSLILFDINHFKSINDSYGHPVGDEVLKQFAQTLKETLRKGEKLYRIGGDEFATILHNCSPEEALYAANRCRTAIGKISFIEHGIKEPIRASIGVAHNNQPTSGSISDLLWQADVAVYSAKKPGQSHVITYSDEIKNISGSILSSQINNIVFDAIESGAGITMYYQPIMNLDSGEPDYYEALLRIRLDSGDIVQPNEVFELIEARKLEYEMDRAIFKQIANDFKAGVIPFNSGVSINVSGPSIINSHIIDKLSLFVPYLSDYKIILEITETSLITHIAQAANHINSLKKMGFKIALDDFGSGYSSISYLSSMPVDIVKFDITLIRQLDDKKQFSIIKHLTAMIRETGHLLVAEGIETTETSEQIKQLGFNYAQGYLYGKPSPRIRN